MTGWIVGSLCVLAALAVGYLLGMRRRRPSTPAAPVTAPDASNAEAAARTALRLLDAMSPAVIVLDSADRVRLANRAARAVNLVREDRVMVRPLLALAREAAADGESFADIEVAGPSGPSGPRVALRGHGMVIGERLVGLVLIDVSESYRVEAVRRDFVANVSHELKTPVGAITLLGEAIEDAADDQDAVRRFAASMQKESKRLSQLINELIELSRLQGGEPIPPGSVVNIAEVVADCTDRARTAAAAKHIRIQTSGDDDLRVVGVQRHLVMALTNLLTNAVSYSPDGTTVAVAYRADGPDALIMVKDQGIGIAADDLKRIFERFFRVDRARSRHTGGTGLGLAIVKHVVNNHGGSVDVWSHDGHGSTFTLRLPRAARDDDPDNGLPERTPADHSMVSDTAMAEPIEPDPPQLRRSPEQQ